jgi:hypothetical protein
MSQRSLDISPGQVVWPRVAMVAGIEKHGKRVRQAAEEVSIFSSKAEKIALAFAQHVHRR